MASEEPVYYRVHSMVRRVATRSLRLRSTGRHRFVTRLAGGDITVRRARPATISKVQLLRSLDEIKAATAVGKIEVRTLRGEVVDLDTLVTTAPKKTASPPADPPLDSAANDKTFEHGIGQVQEGTEKLDDPDVGGVLAGDEEDAVEAGGQDPVRVRKGKRASSKKPKK